MNKLAKILQSRKFKEITIILGVLFFVLTFVISLDPKPFLKFGYSGVFVFNLFGPAASCGVFSRLSDKVIAAGIPNLWFVIIDL